MTTTILIEPELRAFVGTNSNYYMNRWKPLLEGHDWSGFNWAACLLSELWLPYRTMYGLAAGFYGIAFLGVDEAERPLPQSRAFAEAVLRVPTGRILRRFAFVVAE
jgi:hypothetical protein